LEIVNKKQLFTSVDKILEVELSLTKILISTFKNYYIFNLFTLDLIKLGNQEKKGLYSSTFINGSGEEGIYAGRSNGILWKVDSTTGVVKSSLKFDDQIHFQ
jgi:hypothetical protein